MTEPRHSIVFVAGAAFFSGAERALLLSARSLMEQGHRVLVCTGTNGEFLTQLKSAGVPSAHVPVVMSGVRSVPSWLASAARLARLIRRHRANVVHANEAPTFQMAGYVARWLRLPAVTHVRFPDTGPGFAWYMKPGFERALFVSRYLEQDALSVAPSVFGSRSEVVYDGVVTPPPVDDRIRAERRAALGLQPDVPAVVMAGQVIEIKGIFDFIEAVRILRSQQVRAAFYVLGDDLKGAGACRREAERRAEALGLSGDVTFLGFRPDAPQIIPLFDIVAVPSHVEPLGNATLEAMAASRPVVGTKVGGIPEMVVDGETGLLVPAKSPDQLASAVARLVADPGRAEQMGQAGHRRAREVFSLPAHGRHLVRIYDELALGRRARASRHERSDGASEPDRRAPKMSEQSVNDRA